MSNTEPSNITEARDLLAKGEQSQEPSEWVRYYKNAFALLSPDVADEGSQFCRLAANIKETYIRKKIEQMPPTLPYIFKGLVDKKPYNWFREGFDTADLREAEALLDVLRE